MGTGTSRRTRRTSFGTVRTHCRTGTSGKTRSTRCAGSSSALSFLGPCAPNPRIPGRSMPRSPPSSSRAKSRRSSRSAAQPANPAVGGRVRLGRTRRVGPRRAPSQPLVRRRRAAPSAAASGASPRAMPKGRAIRAHHGLDARRGVGHPQTSVAGGPPSRFGTTLRTAHRRCVAPFRRGVRNRYAILPPRGTSMRSSASGGRVQ